MRKLAVSDSESYPLGVVEIEVWYEANITGKVRRSTRQGMYFRARFE